MLSCCCGTAKRSAWKQMYACTLCPPSTYVTQTLTPWSQNRRINNDYGKSFPRQTKVAISINECRIPLLHVDSRISVTKSYKSCAQSESLNQRNQWESRNNKDKGFQQKTKTDGEFQADQNGNIEWGRFGKKQHTWLSVVVKCNLFHWLMNACIIRLPSHCNTTKTKIIAQVTNWTEFVQATDPF